LVGVDVDVLYGDLLLASTSMLIKPLDQRCHCAGGLFGEFKVLRLYDETLIRTPSKLP
jgi:hypothetical protein